jgi:YidC/Oxa1 family membrane protein insertase
VVIYWVTQNVFSLGQQMWVLRKYPPPNVNGKAGMAKQTAKPDTGDKSGNGAAPVAPKALGPKVGAKPVNPKKGGAAKR